MRALALGLLAWVLMAPDWPPLQSFGTVAECRAEAAAWASREKEDARWVNERYRDTPTPFWLEAVQRAADQIARARGAYCVERRS